MKINTRTPANTQVHREKTDPYYNSKTHKKFRDECWKNARGICEECQRQGKLKQLVRGTKDKNRQGVADHIKPRDAGGSDIAKDNGQLMCNSCHAKKSVNDKKYYR